MTSSDLVELLSEVVQLLLPGLVDVRVWACSPDLCSTHSTWTLHFLQVDVLWRRVLNRPDLYLVGPSTGRISPLVNMLHHPILQPMICNMSLTQTC
jgi:hypothetical protein